MTMHTSRKSFCARPARRLLPALVLGAVAASGGCDNTHGIWVGPVAAQSQRFGGGGGSGFNVGCGRDQLVVGYARGRAPSGLFESEHYTFIPVCGEPRIAVGADGEQRSLKLRPVNLPGSFTVQQVCPDDLVVVGLSVRSAVYVDGIALHCAPLDFGLDRNSELILQTVSWQLNPYRAEYGSGSGGMPGEFNCPANLAASSLYGSSAAVMDSIGIGCSYIAP